MTESSTLMCNTTLFTFFEGWCVVTREDTHKSDSYKYVDQDSHNSEAENLLSFCESSKAEDSELSHIKFTISCCGVRKRWSATVVSIVSLQVKDF